MAVVGVDVGVNGDVNGDATETWNPTPTVPFRTLSGPPSPSPVALV